MEEGKEGREGETPVRLSGYATGLQRVYRKTDRKGDDNSVAYNVWRWKQSYFLNFVDKVLQTKNRKTL